MTTQHAWRLHGYGSSADCLQLDELPIPEPGPSQVLVAVSTVAVNPLDWKIRDGYLQDARPMELPATLGVDVVGTVSSLGAGSSRFQVGDRVMTLLTGLGAWAQYVVVDQDILSRIPESVSDAEAATLPIPAMTAWAALHAAGDVRPGAEILIHGASGVTGSFAVQFAKAAGAVVIGTASAKNREYVVGLGADRFVDYATENFEDVVNGVDLVLDFVLVGGDRNTTTRSWGVLKPDGALVSVADPAAVSDIPDGLRGYFVQVTPDAGRLEGIAEQLATGKIRSTIARVFPRGELPEALNLNKAGGTVGRLLVDFTRD